MYDVGILGDNHEAHKERKEVNRVVNVLLLPIGVNLRPNNIYIRRPPKVKACRLVFL